MPSATCGCLTRRIASIGSMRCSPGFGLSTLIGPMMNNAGLYWIAIELTTLISTFLVAFEREAESIEAAWKYIIVVSAGISLALLGTVLFYWSGTFVLGPTYDMTWKTLQEIAPRLNPAVVSLSFLLVLIGYGTKVGLAPMHTWLPDAHSEGPAPVSALLVRRASQHGHGRHRALPGGRRRGRHFDVGARHAARAGRIFAVCRGSFHRPPDGNQAPHGLFERRAHGGYRARLRLRRAARRCGRALPHAQSLAQQIRDVFRRGRRHANLSARSASAASVICCSGCRRSASCGLAGLSPSPGRRRSRCS